MQMDGAMNPYIQEWHWSMTTDAPRIQAPEFATAELGWFEQLLRQSQ